MNWNTPNVIHPDTAKTVFTTKSLIDLFTALDREGYSGLSLGLIIDLVRRDAKAVR